MTKTLPTTTLDNRSTHTDNLDELVDDVFATLTPKALQPNKWRQIEGALMSERAQVKRELRKSRSIKEGNAKRCWEVFAGEGRTSSYLQKLGAEVRTFGLHTGWDFSKRDHQERFLAEMDERTPEEILISPMCGTWSQMQELNARTQEGRQKLIELRTYHHRVFLTFTAKVYKKQQEAGRHCHIEHPWNACSWKTVAFSNLFGYVTYVDQCAYDLLVPDINGQPGLAKKPTCFLTTKFSLHKGLQTHCTKDHIHVPLEGNIPGGGGPRTKYAENYPPKLAKKLAELMMAKDTQQDLENMDIANFEGVYTTENNEHDLDLDDIALHRKLRAEHGSSALNYVKNLHHNLGHPQPEVLVKMLKNAGAAEHVIKVATAYKCVGCLRRVKPDSPPPSTNIPARSFNETLVSDAFWITTSNRSRCCVLSMVCEATRYVAVRVIDNETGEDFIKGLERAWIRHFGCPKKLRVDEARGWCGELLREWCTHKGIELEAITGEAHSGLGIVERRHQVLRRGIELYLDDLGLPLTKESVIEAAIYVPSQINNLAFNRGFTAAQWVLGKQPTLHNTLNSDFYNPTAVGLENQDKFVEAMVKRLRAQVSFLKADTDARLQRAMNRKYKSTLPPLKLGQLCYYWRDQGAGRLMKNRWKGPARVVMVEKKDEKPAMYWIAHGSVLLRCAPYHVQP